MELFLTPDNPMPPNPIVSAVRTKDGLTLRVARWSQVAAKGTVLIATGRSEFIEQYYPVIPLLLERGFDVVIFDWRGQGQSDREIRDGRHGHVTDFAGYRRDLVAVEAQILRPFAPKPWFALGHSMGAAVLIDQAHDGRSPFERLVLSAPMIGIRLRHRAAVTALLTLLERAGLGHLPIPGHHRMPLFERPFADNILTDDLGEFKRLGDAIQAAPTLAVGAPTVRWVVRALRLMRRFTRPTYPVETLTPILILAAGVDRIVDTAATERFGIALKAGTVVTIPEARHQILMETPAVRAQFWQAFDAFVPGERQAETTESQRWADVSTDRAARKRRLSFGFNRRRGATGGA